MTDRNANAAPGESGAAGILAGTKPRDNSQQTSAAQERRAHMLRDRVFTDCIAGIEAAEDCLDGILSIIEHVQLAFWEKPPNHAAVLSAAKVLLFERRFINEVLGTLAKVRERLSDERDGSAA